MATREMATETQLHSRRMVRWTFERGTRAITCQVDAQDGAYHVRIMPHWDLADLWVTREPTPWKALKRHAEIASQLRDAGWCVTRRSN